MVTILTNLLNNSRERIIIISFLSPVVVGEVRNIVLSKSLRVCICNYFAGKGDGKVMDFYSASS